MTPGPPRSTEQRERRLAEELRLLARSLEPSGNWAMIAPRSLHRIADTLDPPLDAAEVREPPETCTCGNGEAEEDRGAVLRCPVHRPDADPWPDEGGVEAGSLDEYQRVREPPEGDRLTTEQAKLAATAVADVWVIQADDEDDPNEATLLHRVLRRIAEAGS